MRLEIKGLTQEQELSWLMDLPWTFTSEPSPDDAGEFVVRIAEIPDATVIGTEKEVSTEIFASLRASLACRLEFNDPINLPRAVVLRPSPIVTLQFSGPSRERTTP